MAQGQIEKLSIAGIFPMRNATIIPGQVQADRPAAVSLRLAATKAQTPARPAGKSMLTATVDSSIMFLLPM
jgi:hypothetical protein